MKDYKSKNNSGWKQAGKDKRKVEQNTSISCRMIWFIVDEHKQITTIKIVIIKISSFV